jgi:hypothetical protein
MPTPMPTEEQELRVRLDEAVGRIRSTLNKCPYVDELDDLDEEDAAAAAALADEANRALADALSSTEALEQLHNASQDAALLCATSRTALGVVREVLTVLSAALDSRQAA